VCGVVGVGVMDGEGIELGRRRGEGKWGGDRGQGEKAGGSGKADRGGGEVMGRMGEVKKDMT